MFQRFSHDDTEAKFGDVWVLREGGDGDESAYIVLHNGPGGALTLRVPVWVGTSLQRSHSLACLIGKALLGE